MARKPIRPRKKSLLRKDWRPSPASLRHVAHYISVHSWRELESPMRRKWLELFKRTRKTDIDHLERTMVFMQSKVVHVSIKRAAAKAALLRFGYRDPIDAPLRNRIINNIEQFPLNPYSRITKRDEIELARLLPMWRAPRRREFLVELRKHWKFLRNRVAENLHRRTDALEKRIADEN